MDFSSANVPISRETWAPRSPPPARGGSAGEGESDRRGSYGSSAPPGRYSDRPPPPSNGNGYGGGGGGGGYGSGPSAESGVYAPPRRPPQAPASVNPNNVLGVFGLSVRTRERDLEDEFGRYGEVEKVVIVYDQRTDRSRGFGFITMRSIEDAGRCIEKLNGFNLHGRPIRVDYSATQKPHQPTPGQYMGEKRPVFEERFAPRDDRYGRRDYDDRRYERRNDDRESYRPRDEYRRRERDDDPYGGRSRRDDYDRDRRRSPSPRRSRYSGSPERRAPPPARDYDAPPPAGEPAPRY